MSARLSFALVLLVMATSRFAIATRRLPTFIWHLFGMPLHLRLKTREHYRTLLDAHLRREVRRWFPRRGDPAAPAARTGRTSLEMRWPEGDSLLFPAAHGGHLASATLYRQFDKARDVAGRPDLRFHELRHSGAVLAATPTRHIAIRWIRVIIHQRRGAAELFGKPGGGVRPLGPPAPGASPNRTVT